jgi:hypothetical protein
MVWKFIKNLINHLPFPYKEACWWVRALMCEWLSVRAFVSHLVDPGSFLSTSKEKNDTKKLVSQGRSFVRFDIGQ